MPEERWAAAGERRPGAGCEPRQHRRQQQVPGRAPGGVRARSPPGEEGALPSGDVAEPGSRAAGLRSRARRSGSRPRSSAGGGEVWRRAKVLFWGVLGMVLGCDCEENLGRGCSLRNVKLAKCFLTERGSA